jgi:hypothetical protein
MNNWIKVDTSILRSYSGGYKNHSTTIGSSGDKTKSSMILVSSAMPDFDGVLQKAAHYDAQEIGKQCKDLSDGFMDDSDLLIRIAKAFEDVDGQTVKIIGDCQDLTSKACFIDQGGDPNLWIEPGKVLNPDGSITTTTSEVVINPDGSRSTLIIVRTTYPDGSVEETKTLRTEKVIDSETASKWNQNAEDVKFYFNLILSGSLGLLTEIGVGLQISEELGFIAGKIVEFATDRATEGIQNSTPERNWEGGDTITNTITVKTTYLPDGTPIQQEVTNTTEVTDKTGEIVSSDTTGIQPTGALK